MHLSSRIVLDCDARPSLWISRLIREQVVNLLVINFQVTDRNCNLLFKLVSNLSKDLSDASWYESTIFIIWRRAIHGEGLACSSLTIAHNCAVEALDHGFDDVFSTVVVYVFLRGIVHDLVKFEFPLFLLVVDETAMGILRNEDSN